MRPPPLLPATRGPALPHAPRPPRPRARFEEDEAPEAPVGNPFVRIKPGYRVLVLCFFFLYVLLAGTFALLSGAPRSELFIPALACLVGVRALPLIMYRPSYGWYHPLVLVAMLSMIQLVKEFPAYAFGLRYHIALPEMSPEALGGLVAWKLSLWTMGLLSYYAAFRYAPRFGVPRIQFPQPTNLRFKVPAVVLASIAIFMVYLQGKGGLQAHMLSWAMGRRTTLAGDFYWFQVATLASGACLIWLATEKRSLRSPLFWVSSLAALGLHFFTTGSRAAVIYVMVIAMMVWMLRERKFAPTRAIAVGFVGLMLLAVLGNLRHSTWQGSVDWSVITDFTVSAASSDATTEIVGRRTTGDGSLPILAHVPGRVDHLYGSTYLAVLTLPVPRSLWKGKPGLVGGRVGAAFFSTRAGIPPTALGEAYWNFSIPGILMAFGLFGFFHAWLARVFLTYHDRPLFNLIYILTLFTAMEPSSESVAATLMSLVPLMMVAYALGAVRLDPYRGGSFRRGVYGSAPGHA